MTRGKRATHAVASPAGGATYRVRIGVLRPVRATEIIAQRSAASRAERYRGAGNRINKTKTSIPEREHGTPRSHARKVIRQVSAPDGQPDRPAPPAGCHAADPDRICVLYEGAGCIAYRYTLVPAIERLTVVCARGSRHPFPREAKSVCPV